MKKTLTLVAALANNRAIGLRGNMPWHLPDELRNFKKITLGKPVIMGRKTREAIGMVLPGRQNIVISRNPGFSAGGCETASSLQRAIELASGPELMIIGGGELYRMALPYAKRMLLTVVDCEPEADTWFPEWQRTDWELTETVYHPADEHHEYSFEMQNWLRSVAQDLLPGTPAGLPAGVP
jgi:dihydrofolate reductase